MTFCQKLNFEEYQTRHELQRIGKHNFVFFNMICYSWRDVWNAKKFYFRQTAVTHSVCSLFGAKIVFPCKSHPELLRNCVNDDQYHPQIVYKYPRQYVLGYFTFLIKIILLHLKLNRCIRNVVHSYLPYWNTPRKNHSNSNKITEQKPNFAVTLSKLTILIFFRLNYFEKNDVYIICLYTNSVDLWRFKIQRSF